MTYLSGYNIIENIFKSDNSIIHRGIRLDDNKPVIIKCLRKEYPTSEEKARFGREYEIINRLRGDRIINVYSIEKYNNSLAIILEDFGGNSINKYLLDKKLDIITLLSIAVQMTEALRQVQQQNIIHKDINPSNFVWNPTSNEIKIIDFGISSELSRENLSLCNPNILEGTLKYISPEQTGRMNKSIDYRTDFYSLGITFYEMFTGHLPFQADDAMGMVHCHIATKPKPPIEIKPEIPAILSDIVMKLMLKIPQERYQSAFGLKTDLENCLDQLKTTGNIKAFKIGKNDVSEKFQIPQKLYGREVEKEKLLKTFDRVSKGTKELMLVAGFSGTGKSALVQELYKPITEKRGKFISGKFDQLKRNIPYTAIIQAFRALVKQLLAEDKNRLALYKQKIKEALEPVGQVVINVIPEFELIIGKQPQVEALDPEQSRNRFNIVFQNLIKVFAEKDSPLVMFIDDLQWADPPSFKLIVQFMIDTDYLLIIGAFRDNEVDEGHSLMLVVDDLIKEGSVVNTITLKPLAQNHVNQLIAETLSCDLKKSIKLSELCVNKTAGNPFFLNQFLKTLYEEQLISYSTEEGIWVWDENNIHDMGITDNVVDLMLGKIKKLSIDAQEILKMASCVGNQFDLNTLTIITEKPKNAISQVLFKVLKEGLIVPVDDSYKFISKSYDDFNVSYRFLHDRIQQASYSLIEEKHKKQVHLKIGRLLLENLSAEEQKEKIFTISDHLNHGIELIEDIKERDNLADLNLLAGIRAKEAAAYKPSYEYLSFGIELLGKTGWKRRFKKMLSLHEEAEEATCLSGNYEKTKELFEIIMQNTVNVLDKTKAYQVRIVSLNAEGKLKESVEMGLEIIQLLGVWFPKNPNMGHVISALLITKIKLLGKKDEDLLSLNEMTDANMLSIVGLLSVITTAAYTTHPNTFLIMCLKRIPIIVKYGFDPFTSPDNYCAYGLILCSIGDIEKGYHFGKIGKQMLNMLVEKKSKTRVVMIFNSFIRHWKEHIRQSLKDLITGYESRIETGDVEFAAHCAMVNSFNIYFSGINLQKVENDQKNLLKSTKNLKQKLQADSIALFCQLTKNLIYPTDPKVCQTEISTQLCGDFFDENEMLPALIKEDNKSTLCGIYLLKLNLAYFAEEFKDAFEFACESKKYIDGVRSTFLITIVNFYDSLTRLMLFNNTNYIKSRQHLIQVNINQRKMKKWARHAPMNFLHKWHIVEAEKARVLKNDKKAIENYKLAIEGAHKNEYTQEEALAYELYAKFWLNKKEFDFAGLYMKKAVYFYSLWGAQAKVHQLAKKYEKILSEQEKTNRIKRTTETATSKHASSSTTEGITERLDLSTIMKASRTISSEIFIGKLLVLLMKAIMENAGAQKGLMILEKNGHLFVEAETVTGEDEINVMQTIPIENHSGLSQNIVNFVARTRETILLNNAAIESNFADDPYVFKNKPKSILCSAIVNRGKLTGVVYLENNLTTGAFTSNRLEILDILSSQASISIENAKLFEKSRKSEEKYRNIIKSIEDGYFETDIYGKFMFINDSFSEITGFAKEEILEMNYENLIDQKIADKVYSAFQNVYITQKPAKGFEFEIIRKDTDRVIVEISISLIKNPEKEVIGFRGIIRDISERKKREGAEREREAAKASNRAKSDFLANMSHEIRTPMNAIIGLTGLALKTELSSKQFDYLNKIERSANSLLGIINEILDFSKIEAGKMELESINFNLEDVLENVSNLIGIKAEEKGIELLFDIHKLIPYYLVGDPLRLGQILINLASNAVKFTEFGQIVIKIEKPIKSNGYSKNQAALKFSIQDSGIGMTDGQVGRLFKSFSQADNSTTRKYGGTGLGLTISKQLIEMMNGEIWVDSTYGKGSTFFFTAEFNLQEKIPEKKYECPEDLLGMRTLLVDDNPIARKILTDILVSFQFEVKQVSSGPEAIFEIENAILNNPYQLVVMDWKMPGMDGIETSKRIKRLENFSNTPFILMVTAYCRDEIRHMVQDARIDAFLTKPVNPSILYDTIVNIFGKAASARLSLKEDSEKIIGIEKIKGAKILLVEDNEINQQVAMELLEQAGFLVMIANNGEKAVHLMDEADYDLIFMDINMPVMDGFTATGIIRSNMTNKYVPIIAMTAHAVDGYREKCLEAGMNDYITKPIKPREFFTTLVKWIPPGNRELPSRQANDVENNILRPIPDELPGLDYQAGLKTLQGSQKSYHKILKLFHSKNQNMHKAIEDAITTKDLEIAIRLAHSVKGVAGNIGAHGLYKISAKLEVDLMEGKVESAVTHLDTFSDSLKTVLLSIASVLSTNSEVSPIPPKLESIDTDRAQGTILHLIQTLQTEFSKAPLHISTLKKIMGDIQEIQAIEEAIEDFDADEAIKKIEQLARKYNFSINGRS